MRLGSVIQEPRVSPHLLALYRHLAGDGLPLVAFVGQRVALSIGQLGEADGLNDHRQGRGQELDPVDGPQDAKALQAGQGLPARAKR